MTSKLTLLLALILTLHYAHGLGRSGGGSRGGGGGSRGGSRGSSSGTSSNRGGALFGASKTGGSGFGGARNTGYGSHGSRIAPPRTSIYTRNYGSYANARRSSSYNGFGLGLGVGLLVGFGAGGLGRPIGYSAGGYGYGYIHHHRRYKTTVPLHCAVANVSEYLKEASDFQEINIDEGEEVCSVDQDVCFGRMEITAVNFTTDGNLYEGLEVKIEKGCEKRANLDQLQVGLNYSSGRQCWTSSLYEADYDNETSLDVLVDGVPETLVDAMGLAGRDFDLVEISSQFELCVCQGWYCNAGLSLTSCTAVIAMVSVLMLLVVCWP